MPGFKKLLGFLLFASLMLIKVSALHVYTHDDTEADSVENCSICEIAMEHQSSDFQFQDVTVEVRTPEVAPDVPKILADQRFKTTGFNFLLFSRPPPTCIV